MAEYVDVNEYAFNGGDTAPGTAEQIAARNKATQEVVDKQVDTAKQLQAAYREHLDELADIEDEHLAGKNQYTGDPVQPAFEPVGLSGDKESGRYTRKEMQAAQDKATKKASKDK